MTIEWSVVMSSCAILLGAAGFVWGGLRFRRWSVEDRIGQPRFPNHIETVLLWLVYSFGIAFVIVLTLQVFRHL